jgi:DNA-directed RNA polymerase specialized sigma24 family protein
MDAGGRAYEAGLRLIMSDLSPLEREALLRFYSLGQTPNQIHRDLDFDVARFRELKSRVRRAVLALSKPQ